MLLNIDLTHILQSRSSGSSWTQHVQHVTQLWQKQRQQDLQLCKPSS
jgi:hypothetical protein